MSRVFGASSLSLCTFPHIQVYVHHSCVQTTLFLLCWKAAGDTEVDGKLKCNEIIWVAEHSGAVWCQSNHSRSESCYQRHCNRLIVPIIVRQYRTILTARVIYANEVILHANAIDLLHDQCSGSANYALFFCFLFCCYEKILQIKLMHSVC